MAYILVIWTVVGTGYYMGTTKNAHDWRPIGEFSSLAACEQAAQRLGKTPKSSACLTK